jgi:hypothetical protein
MGVDITQEIEASRLKQAISIQKMLRQWLHSIRNASFEQQAKVILEEVATLKQKLHSPDFDQEFKTVFDCIKLLMHTAKTSVGLIDQALDTNGMAQNMNIADFFTNLANLPHHIAQSEGAAGMFTEFNFFLNGERARISDYASMFVKGDVINIQSITDHILSNAVR